MADVKISALQNVEKLVNGIKIPVSVEVAEGKWKSQSLITSADDFANYTYAGVLGHLAQGTGISIAEADGVYTVSSTLDTEVFVFANTLPTENINTNKIYLVPGGADDDDQNKLIEYVRVEKEGEEARWEKIGEQHAAVDFTEVNDAIDAKYTKPEDGIPASDLASAVQASLGKADTALQEHQDLKLSEDYATAEGTNTELALAAGDTFEAAFSKLEKAILDNEDVDATAVANIASAVGLSDSLEYSTEKDATVTSVSAAIDKLFELVAGKQDKAGEGDAAYATVGQVNAKYTKPASGIPADDLAQAVKDSLALADSAIQSLDGYATEQWVENKHYLVAADIEGKQDVIDNDNKLGAALIETTDELQFVTAAQKTAWSGKQDAIADLATIRSNAEAGKAAKDALDAEAETYAALKTEVQALRKIVNAFVSRFEYSVEGEEVKWGKEFLVVDNDEAGTTE